MIKMIPKQNISFYMVYKGNWTDTRQSMEKEYIVGKFKYSPKEYTCTIKKAKIEAATVVKMLKSKECVFINAFFRDANGGQIVVRRIEKSTNTVVRVAKLVRNVLEAKYGTGTDLAGTCIEASETLAAIYRELGFKGVKTVEGWCMFDDDSCCSDRPYDEHTWVELSGKIYVDITADQFNPGMYLENKFKPIIICEGLPHGMCYDEPQDW